MRACLVTFSFGSLLLALGGTALLPRTARALEDPPPIAPRPGFTALFNGTDLSGWKGRVRDPRQRAALAPADLAAADAARDENARQHWRAADGAIQSDGGGEPLASAGEYADFELLLEWRLPDKGDGGLSLRGAPRVRICDAAVEPLGSGGLAENQRFRARPLIRADKAPGEWNTFRVFVVGGRVTVYLNGLCVADDVPLENAWERDKPLPASGPIELIGQGGPVHFRNIALREFPRLEERVTPSALVAAKGDRVAIVGDSITEQRLYSRFVEDYLIACVPHLDLRVLQLGWSGERAPDFFNRMANDLLPWQPDVVTTCYGMNDGGYRPYEAAVGETYEKALREIVARLKSSGARVVVGSPGAVDTQTFRRSGLAPDVYNDNLSHLRDIARDIAIAEGQPFANVFDPMILAMLKAKPVLGNEYHVCGADGFHPWENGHLVMAGAFLKSLGLDGEIGTISIDWKGGATASDGHSVVSFDKGELVLESTRYPFCFTGDDTSPRSTRSILAHITFNEDLNRFVLRVSNFEADRAKVTWGSAAKSFPRADLERGVNLAAEFLDNPFSETFARVDARVVEKQKFETVMVKEHITRFRAVRELLGESPEIEAAFETLRRKFFAREEELHQAVRAAVQPIRHTLSIVPE